MHEKNGGSDLRRQDQIWNHNIKLRSKPLRRKSSSIEKHGEVILNERKKQDRQNRSSYMRTLEGQRKNQGTLEAYWYQTLLQRVLPYSRQATWSNVKTDITIETSRSYSNNLCSHEKWKFYCDSEHVDYRDKKWTQFL